MMTIRQASMPEDREAVHGLFVEYVRWVCPRIYEEYGAVFDAESIIVHDMETIMELDLAPRRGERSGSTLPPRAPA